jgi:hypothetical protein
LAQRAEQRVTEGLRHRSLNHLRSGHMAILPYRLEPQHGLC